MLFYPAVEGFWGVWGRGSGAGWVRRRGAMFVCLGKYQMEGMGGWVGFGGSRWAGGQLEHGALFCFH